ncbi:nicotinamide riboside transporter PnuC [Oceanobacter kriegii]|uniref:nicotinamide riboside transporter PnuC n=1 Tax=Oceanobacter kriegii TaxID=64972 RepID=UPI00040ADC9B|nr:nicotinamide riboside transporter PnuC [Oceanobacter kriegii]
MTDIVNAIIEGFAAQSMAEWIAVILGVAYLVFAMRQSNLCWYAAFGSTAIFSWLFWDVSLVMESALNVYYLVMAVYGWWAWRSGSNSGGGAASNVDSTPLPVQSWGFKQHGLVLLAIAVLTFTSGYLLTENTSAALPYLDSFTTWGAVITTWMVTRKVLENWIYWVVIDAVAIYLYIDRGLYPTAFLMAIYVVLAVGGFWLWLKDYRSQQDDLALGQSA